MISFLQKLYDLEKRKNASNPTEYSLNFTQFQKLQEHVQTSEIEMVNYYIAHSIKSSAMMKKMDDLVIRGSSKKAGYSWTSFILLGQSIPELNYFTYQTICVMGSNIYIDKEIERESGLLWAFTQRDSRPFKSFTPNSIYNREFKNNINEEWVAYFLNTPSSVLENRCLETARSTEERKRIAETARSAEERKRTEEERLKKVQKGKTHGFNILNMVSKFDVKTADIRREIEQGADINYQNDEGYTPLMRAVDSNNERIAEYLLRLGANPLLKNKYNETASQLASEESAIYEKLKGFELIFLTYNKDLKAIQILINSTRVNVNFKEPKYGYTSLLISIEENQQEIIKYLLSVNADVYATLSDGRGVMELAKKNNGIEQLLQEHMQTLNDTYEHTSALSEPRSNAFFN